MEDARAGGCRARVGGTTSTESQALRDAHRRIEELEDELALVKAANEIFDAQAVVDPKRRQAVVVELTARGFESLECQRLCLPEVTDNVDLKAHAAA